MVENNVKYISLNKKNERFSVLFLQLMYFLNSRFYMDIEAIL